MRSLTEADQRVMRQMLARWATIVQICEARSYTPIAGSIAGSRPMPG